MVNPEVVENFKVEVIDRSECPNKGSKNLSGAGYWEKQLDKAGYEKALRLVLPTRAEAIKLAGHISYLLRPKKAVFCVHTRVVQGASSAALYLWKTKSGV